MQEIRNEEGKAKSVIKSAQNGVGVILKIVSKREIRQLEGATSLLALGEEDEVVFFTTVALLVQTGTVSRCNEAREWNLRIST